MYASQLHQMQFLMYDAMGASYMQKAVYDGDDEAGNSRWGNFVASDGVLLP